MSSSRMEDPNSLFNIVRKGTKNLAPVEALTTFSTHMLTGSNVHDGIVSATIAASSAPLIGGMMGLTFFKSLPPKSPLISAGLLNLYSFIASQAMFHLFNELIGISVSHSRFTTNTVAGLFALTTFISLYEDLRAESNLVDGSKSSFIRGLCR
jgi:hypothetical protein